MNTLSIGTLIIAISALGYLSNWLNWRFLNYRLTHWLYYLGAFIHETSHALLCLLTGARVYEYKVFSSQPHVTHSSSRLPLIGNLLIAIAPLFGGLAFLYSINTYVFSSVYQLPQLHNWSDLLSGIPYLFWQINLSHWQGLVMILLFINIGAMLGPSWQDLKNIWFFLLILLLIYWPFFINLGLLAVALIIINIIIQVILIFAILIIKNLYRLSK